MLTYGSDIGRPAVGHTLTVWFDDPTKEHVCEETTDEVVLMKNDAGRVIGFELLHYHKSSAAPNAEEPTRPSSPGGVTRRLVSRAQSRWAMPTLRHLVNHKQ